MPSRRGLGALCCLFAAALSCGCRGTNFAETAENDTAEVDAVMARVDQPVEDPIITEDRVQPATIKTISATVQPEYWDVSLDQVIGISMMNSQVLRDLGATVLRNPQSLQTRYSRLLAESDPRFGMEAALSAFDAQFFTSALFQDSNHFVNNRLLSGTDALFMQDKHDYVAQISKLTATGAQLSLRSITDYDHNNVVTHLFRTAWQQQFEAEIRQPLMQGGGLTFNRIAGPGAVPGVSNGVLIAKVNTDINAVDFERGIRDYVSDVVNAYWDLYFSYRDLDAKQAALQRSRQTWQSYKARDVGGRESAASEALAREQYYRFRSDVKDAVAGKVGQRTQEYNGVTGGVFRGMNGVQVAERRLRLMIGLPINESQTLRPIDDPESAPVNFHWDSLVEESLKRRPELRAQRLLVKRRELELIASRNFLAPRLDLVGSSRVRGLGNDLIGDDVNGYGSAFSDVGSFDHRDWTAGVEFSVQLGARRGHAAVNNAEFLLARDRALLAEQERQILHDLSNTIGEADRAYEQVQDSQNRYLAASEALESLQAADEANLNVNLEQLLDIQRRLTEAQSRYYQSRVEYAIALKNVHVEKGSILEYADLQMTDMTVPIAASVDGVITTESLLAAQQKDAAAAALAADADGTKPGAMEGEHSAAEIAGEPAPDADDSPDQVTTAGSEGAPEQAVVSPQVVPSEDEGVIRTSEIRRYFMNPVEKKPEVDSETPEEAVDGESG